MTLSVATQACSLVLKAFLHRDGSLTIFLHHLFEAVQIIIAARVEANQVFQSPFSVQIAFKNSHMNSRNGFQIKSLGLQSQLK